MDWLSIREYLLDTIKYIFIIFSIMVIIIYVVSITQVVGESMSPTLKNGEVLILNKLRYHFVTIERGDIVSLNYADTKYLIKRVIGIPGDKIKIVNNQLYINNKIYQEKYLNKNLTYTDFHLQELGYEVIPENMYLVLGDNRSNSLDSRKIGLINKKDITGRITLRIWPINKLKFF